MAPTVTNLKDRDRSDRRCAVINICRLTDALFGTDWRKQPTYQEQAPIIAAWAKRHRLFHYARDRQDFCLAEACRLAEQGGYLGVILEDLS